MAAHGGARLRLAGLPPHGPRARHGAGLPGARAAAGRPAAGLLARLAARPRASGCALWFAAVPLRLRGVAVLATSAAGAVPVALWAFGQPGLSEDKAGLAERTAAGLGVRARRCWRSPASCSPPAWPSASRRPRGRRGPSARRQAGVAVLVVVGLVPVVVLAGLALSERGLGGSISKGWKDLTDPSARGDERRPAPDRARQRARAVLGRGAAGLPRGQAPRRRRGRLRDRPAALPPRHPRRAPRARLRRADAGRPRGRRAWRVSLALLAAFLAAAGRTTGLWGPARRTRRRRPSGSGS